MADLLRGGFSLQGNAKTIEDSQVPDRDAQFRYLNERVREHRDAGEPVISVDTKKKELAGNHHNGGREWRPAGDAVRVRSHDFPGQVGDYARRHLAGRSFGRSLSGKAGYFAWHRANTFRAGPERRPELTREPGLSGL